VREKEIGETERGRGKRGAEESPKFVALKYS